MNNTVETNLPSGETARYTDYVYAGFWRRLVAWLLDALIILGPMVALLVLAYGTAYFANLILYDGRYQGYWDVFIQNVLPVIYVLFFWLYKQATPGKMMLRALIVDAKTGNKPTWKQFIIRYLGYFVSLIPLGLGFFWVLWDKKKQAWHDKLAGTVVLRKINTRIQAVSFTEDKSVTRS